MRRAFALLRRLVPALLLLGGSAASVPAQEPPPGRLALEIAPVASAVALGEPLDVVVRLANRGLGPLTLLLPIDGCTDGWRRVSYEWRLDDADGIALRSPPPLVRCGNVNALRCADFVTLRPGERHELRATDSFLHSPRFPGPGTYRISLAYTFDPARAERGLPLGEDEPGTAALLAQALVVEAVVSNVVTVTVLPHGR